MIPLKESCNEQKLNDLKQKDTRQNIINLPPNNY